jgi:hypothetical protein
MATLSAKVFRHHKKADGTYNVKIYIYHNSVRAYMDTEHYVTDKMLTKDLQIKDAFLLSPLNKKPDDYRRSLTELGNKLSLLDAHSLKEYFLKKDESIDFLAFYKIHIDYLKSNGQLKSAANYNTLYNHLLDFFQSDKFPISEITTGLLRSFVKFLGTNRRIIRKNQFGDLYQMDAKKLAESSIANYLRDFSGFFTAAMYHYNKPVLGFTPIVYNPFTDFRRIERRETKKRNLDVDRIIKIRDCQPEKNSRAELARDMFMLSFYLCGINAVDLYKGDYCIVKGRIEYNRSKRRVKEKTTLSLV